MLVIALTLAAQFGGLASQFVFAFLFGASSETDALFAALAVPTYVIAVVASALAVVFVPIFIEHRTRSGPDAAAVVASGTVNIAALGLIALAAAGAVFADPIIALSAPGLSPAGRELAADLAVVVWPSVVGSGLLALLTALWQAERGFGWPAAVPLAGAATNVALTVVLGRAFGIGGAAIALTASVALQAALLAPVLAPRWRPILGLDYPGVRAVIAALVPFLLASLVFRISTILERFLASGLPSGELTHLAYASRIVLTVGLLLSSGPAAVMFPRMAEDAAALDHVGLRNRAAVGIRWVWLVAAPLIAMVIALAEPGVRVLFERGAFTREDSTAVAALLRVYAPSLAAIALAAVTGRALYALQATRVVATVGVVESALYIAYTTFLAGRLGAAGIALGFTIYLLQSVAWHPIYLRRVLGGSGRGLVRSFLASGGVAAVSGIVAWTASQAVEVPLGALVLGGAAGLASYAAGIVAVQRLRLAEPTVPDEVLSRIARWRRSEPDATPVRTDPA
jgi:putative peptidoglycan lipid II flippase